MIKLNEKVRSIFYKFNNDSYFGFGHGYPVAKEYDMLLEAFESINVKKTAEVVKEYIELTQLKKGDSFNNHFQLEKEKHLWKTDNGFYLGYVVRYGGGDDYRIDIFENREAADKLTKSEVEASDFDMNKVRICDEEFE